MFAGAGVSLSPPACLPTFNWVRDEVLTQLRLGAYVEDSPDGDPARVAVATGLAPEPFMRDLLADGVALERWLREVLDGRPNAAHHALAQLASSGATVWTVNFDRLIERAGHDLEVIAWPEAPTRPADLVKPHGSIGGELIVTADHVLRGLEEPWRERLRKDVRDRTVVFVGYSGRDLDFQPMWDSVLADARRVLWFDQPDEKAPGRMADEARRGLLLRGVAARGALRFMPAPAPPLSFGSHARPNAAADFVSWCVREDLVDVDPRLLALMFESPTVTFPPLEGDLDWARASMLGHLGDHGAAQAQRRALLRRRGARIRTARALIGASVTNGTGLGRAILVGARALPPVGRLAEVRAGAQRKWITALHREARHEEVLRATAHIDASSVSTVLILRSSALRLLGSLDEAASVADEALSRARREGHAVRTAHAAFQKALALLWAERVEEAQRCLEDELRPYASVAANRWVAWSHFIEGGLAVRAGDAERARQALEVSEALFAAEALMDGVVSARLARLTAHRLAGDDELFSEGTRRLAARPEGDRRDWRWYAQSSGITALALAIERAEFARMHGADRAEAERLYRGVAQAPYPLYAGLGRLGVALCASDRDERAAHASRARADASRIGARLVAARAQELLADRPDAEREVFFC